MVWFVFTGFCYFNELSYVVVHENEVASFWCLRILVVYNIVTDIRLVCD